VRQQHDHVGLLRDERGQRGTLGGRVGAGRYGLELDVLERLGLGLGVVGDGGDPAVVGGRRGEADDHLLARCVVAFGVGVATGVGLGVGLLLVAGARGEQGARAECGATEEEPPAYRVVLGHDDLLILESVKVSWCRAPGGRPPDGHPAGWWMVRSWW
jgi:hypothetical protein